jgi:hypothetical protein
LLRRITQAGRPQRYFLRPSVVPGVVPGGFADLDRPRFVHSLRGGLWHPCPVKRDYHALRQISGLRASGKYDSLTKLRKTTPYLVASEAALEHRNRAPLPGRESAGNIRSRCGDAFGLQDTGSTTLADGRGSKPRRNRSWGR